jgi:fermentation-respiration switch protein FrsA (DUF1100 family)
MRPAFPSLQIVRYRCKVGERLIWASLIVVVDAATFAVLGHSVGAGAALLEASPNRDIAVVISIAAFVHPAEVTRGYLHSLRLPQPISALVVRYVEWVIGYRFEAVAPINTTCRIACPVLLVHGRDDETVPVGDAQASLTSSIGEVIARAVIRSDRGATAVGHPQLAPAMTAQGDALQQSRPRAQGANAIMGRWMGIGV